MGPCVLPHRQEQEREHQAGSPESVATRVSVCVSTVLPAPLSCHGHWTPVSKFHLSNPLNHGKSLHKGAYLCSHNCMIAREEKALWDDAVRECVPARRGHLGMLGGGAGVGKSQWLEQRLMAFGGRAWHANHPVLRQACTMRSFPTRSKTHIHNFQTYKLISTHM